MTPTKILSFFLCFCLILEQGVFAQTIDLSHYFARNSASAVTQSDKFRPLHLRYISYDNQANDFKILLDKGDFFNQKTEKPKNEKTLELENTTQELMKYFFIGLSLPNEKFWVNLRPDSPDNILDPELEKTDIGRIFLEADLQLKKDTSGMTSPQTKEGRVYWDKLYNKAGELFGSENITIPTITRPWIVPNEIIIREAPDNAYIYKATLKVMLEEDYLKSSQLSAVSSQQYNFKDQRLKELNEYSTQLIKETIIPKLTYAVNTAKRYAPLRQVYYSLILAQWFKQKYGGLGSARAPGTRAPVNSYVDQIDSGNLANLTSKEPYDKQAYFQQYQKSFMDGEYTLSEPVYTPMGQSIRRYMSGGVELNCHPFIGEDKIIALKGPAIKQGYIIEADIAKTSSPVRLGKEDMDLDKFLSLIKSPEEKAKPTEIRDIVLSDKNITDPEYILNLIFGFLSKLTSREERDRAFDMALAGLKKDGGRIYRYGALDILLSVLSGLDSSKERLKFFELGIALAKETIDPGDAFIVLKRLFPKIHYGEKDRIFEDIKVGFIKLKDELAKSGVVFEQISVSLRDLLYRAESIEEINKIFDIELVSARKSFRLSYIFRLEKLLHKITSPEERAELFDMWALLVNKNINPTDAFYYLYELISDITFSPGEMDKVLEIGIVLAAKGIDPDGSFSNLRWLLKKMVASEGRERIFEAGIELAGKGIDPKYTFSAIRESLPYITFAEQRDKIFLLLKTFGEMGCISSDYLPVIIADNFYFLFEFREKKPGIFSQYLALFMSIVIKLDRHPRAFQIIADLLTELIAGIEHFKSWQDFDGLLRDLPREIFIRKNNDLVNFESQLFMIKNLPFVKNNPALIKILQDKDLLDLLDNDLRPRDSRLKGELLEAYKMAESIFVLDRFSHSLSDSYHSRLESYYRFGYYNSNGMYRRYQQAYAQHFSLVGGKGFNFSSTDTLPFYALDEKEDIVTKFEKGEFTVVIIRYGMLKTDDMAESEKAKITAEAIRRGITICEGVVEEKYEDDFIYSIRTKFPEFSLKLAHIKTARKEIPIYIEFPYSKAKVLETAKGSKEASLLGIDRNLSRVFYVVDGEIISICLDLPRSRQFIQRQLPALEKMYKEEREDLSLSGIYYNMIKTFSLDKAIGLIALMGSYGVNIGGHVPAIKQVIELIFEGKPMPVSSAVENNRSSLAGSAVNASNLLSSSSLVIEYQAVFDENAKQSEDNYREIDGEFIDLLEVYFPVKIKFIFARLSSYLLYQYIFLEDFDRAYDALIEQIPDLRNLNDHNIMFIRQGFQKVIEFSKGANKNNKAREFVMNLGIISCLQGVDHIEKSGQGGKVMPGSGNSEHNDANKKPFYDLAAGPYAMVYFRSLLPGRKYIYVDSNPFVIAYLDMAAEVFKVKDRVEVREKDILDFKIPKKSAGTVRLYNIVNYIDKKIITDDWLERLMESIAPGGQIIVGFGEELGRVGRARNMSLINRLAEMCVRQKGWQIQEKGLRFEFTRNSSGSSGIVNDLKPKRGGIAFNSLPIQTESFASSTLGVLPGGRAFRGDLDAEWARIQDVFNAGVRPSIQRISEYTAAVVASPLAEDKIDQVRVMLADILRREEESEKLSPAEESCKQFLRALEAG